MAGCSSNPSLRPGPEDAPQLLGISSLAVRYRRDLVFLPAGNRRQRRTFQPSADLRSGRQGVFPPPPPNSGHRFRRSRALQPDPPPVRRRGRCVLGAHGFISVLCRFPFRLEYALLRSGVLSCHRCARVRGAGPVLGFRSRAGGLEAAGTSPAGRARLRKPVAALKEVLSAPERWAVFRRDSSAITAFPMSMRGPGGAVPAPFGRLRRRQPRRRTFRIRTWCRRDIRRRRNLRRISGTLP